MKFGFTEAQEQWRSEVRALLRDELPADSSEDAIGPDASWALNRSLTKKLAERGWLGVGWPKEYGGLGAGPTMQMIFNEELGYHRAPDPGGIGIRFIGPALIVLGTEAQKQRYLPGIIKGDDVWCQGFSEPGAGSDLASLTTRAVEDGDFYVVNGQKIWTSHAHRANYCYLATRTDPEAPKHKGITLMAVDMKSPGLSVRPLIDLGDGHVFNELFFEDVRVPVGNRVGEENRGWYVAMTLLDFERSNIGGAIGAKRTLGRLLEQVKADPLLRERLASSTLRHELAQRYIETEVMYQFSMRIVSMQNRGLIPNDEASMAKLFNSELSQRVAQTCMQVLGLTGQVIEGDDEASFGRLYLGMVPATIRGGTSEVQRNVIATRGLGLPRG